VLKARDVAAGGAFSIDGKMVDAPVIRIAEQFLLTSSMGSTSTT
jgi:citrate lyase beta subunit